MALHAPPPPPKIKPCVYMNSFFYTVLLLLLLMLIWKLLEDALYLVAFLIVVKCALHRTILSV